MWDFVPSCIRRHRKKFFFFGGVIGGIAILNTYLKKKFLEWEAQRTAEFSDQIKRSSHFEGTMLTCDSALISFAPKIREIVCTSVDVNPVVEELKGNPPNKMALWGKLKVLVFTQAVGEMYAQCLLAVLLRVQMSILGGYVFSMSQFSTPKDSAKAAEQQQKYMSRIADFIGHGINELLIPVRKAVDQTTNSVPLNKPLKLQDVGDIIASICTFVTQDNVLSDVSAYLTPADSNGIESDKFLNQIYDETRDVLECKDFNQVLLESIDLGVSSIMDRLSECYVILSDGKDKFVNPHEFSAPLAKIIPMMHNVFSQHEPAEQGALVHFLLQQNSLNAFAANIYEAFSQKS